MRNPSLKSRMLTDEFLCGTMLSEVSLPNIATILSACGFDFIIIDCEHGYFDFAQVASIIAVAKGAGISVIVRLPNNSRVQVLRYMDMGATGVLLPMTNTAEDIAKVVQHAKYAPVGGRGISTTRAHNGYDGANFEDYMKRANEETLVFAQIETVQGLSNLDSILDVAGVDGVMVGPNDLSMDLGIFGQLSHAKMEDAINQVVIGVQKHGKHWAVITSNTTFLKSCREKGMTLASCNSEVGMIKKFGENILQQLKP